MKLSRIGLKGVAGLPDIEAEFGPSPPGLVFVEGGPASGKTRLIEAVLAGLEVAGPYHGIVRAEDWVAPGGAFQRAEIQLDFALDDVEHEDARAFGPLGEDARVVVSFERGPAGHTVQRRVDRGLARLLERYAHDGRAGKREYFPETRQLAWGSRNDGTGALQQSLLRSTKDPQKYSFIARYLESACRDKPERERVAEAVARLVPWLRFVAAGDSFGFARKNAAPTSLGRLSGFEADSVLVAATACMLRLERSLVFLDRPELAVPPSDIVRWVGELGRLGGGNQWIVATSSEALLERAERSQIVSLVEAS